MEKTEAKQSICAKLESPKKKTKISGMISK
jgi:hypothetical protein